MVQLEIAGFTSKSGMRRGMTGSDGRAMPKGPPGEESFSSYSSDAITCAAPLELFVGAQPSLAAFGACHQPFAGRR